MLTLSILGCFLIALVAVLRRRRFQAPGLRFRRLFWAWAAINTAVFAISTSYSGTPRALNIFMMAGACLLGLAQIDRSPGLAIFAIGVTMNLIVISLNGGHMPAYLSNIIDDPVRQQLFREGAVRAQLYTDPGQTTQLGLLGDWIPFYEPLFFSRALISPGDVCILIGLLWTWASCWPRRPAVHPAAQSLEEDET